MSLLQENKREEMRRQVMTIRHLKYVDTTSNHIEIVVLSLTGDTQRCKQFWGRSGDPGVQA